MRILPVLTTTMSPQSISFDMASLPCLQTMASRVGGGRIGRKDLDPQLRARLCELHSLGLSYGHIHKRHPEVSISTIKTTVRRERERVNNVSRPRGGRPQKLSEEHRSLLYIAVNENPHLGPSDLRKLVGNTVTVRTIQNLLKEWGMKRVVPVMRT